MNSQRKNYPMNDFRAIFPISSIFVIRSGYAKKRSFLNISCNSKYMGYINLGCRFEFRTQKLPYKTISGNFFDFIDFGHQVRVCKKRSHLNISCNYKNMGFTYILVADLNSERKNYPIKEFRAIFHISPIFMQKKIISQY